MKKNINVHTLNIYHWLETKQDVGLLVGIGSAMQI